MSVRLKYHHCEASCENVRGLPGYLAYKPMAPITIVSIPAEKVPVSMQNIYTG